MKKLILITISVLFLAFLACGKGGESKKDKKEDTKKVEKTEKTEKTTKTTKKIIKKSSGPREGGSCKGMGTMAGKVSCDGNKVIVCSSFTKYVWRKTKVCGGGTKCVVAPNGKSASCK